MKYIKKYWYILAIIIISIIRFLYSYKFPSLYFMNLGYDDSLMVDLFNHLVKGNYLGIYNDTTLVKGIIYPIMLFYAYKIKITFPAFFTIFYIISSLFFVSSLKNIIKNKPFRLLIYLIILFNPVTFSSELLQRLYVNTIVIPEVLFFFGLVIKILTIDEERIMNYIFLGFISGIMLLTRNDFIWLYVILVLLIIIKIIKYKKLYIKTFIPFALIILLLNIFSFINYKQYGIYTYNEIDNSAFTKAYKNILRIKDDDKKDKIAIPKTTLYKLSEVSKTFDFTKEEIDNYYSKIALKDGEIDNGNIIWMFRGFIYQKHKFKNGKAANDYYKKLNKDIEKAFKDKKLKKENTSFSVYINNSSKKNIFNDLPKSIIKGITYTTSYQNVRTISKDEIDKLDRVFYMSYIDTYGVSYRNYRYAENMITNNIESCEVIRILYKFFTIIFSIIALLFYLKNIRKKDKLNLIIHILLLTYLMILFGVCYTDATAFHAIRYRYLAPIYILQSIFILLNLYRPIYNKEKDKVPEVKEDKKIIIAKKETKKMHKISVIIPAYNEEKVIGETIAEIKKVLKKNKFSTKSEIIVINDGSTDNTRKVALSKKVIVLDNPENMGYGYSLKKGIMQAKNELIAITDADMTYPFESINEMLIEKDKGFDLVVGARNGKYYKESVHKMILRKILKKLVEFVAERKVKDINSGLRLFDKTTVIKFFPRLCNTFSFTTSQTLAYMMNSLTVSYVDINYNKRYGKSKVRLIRDSLKALKYILEACIYYNPMKVFSSLSILCVLLSVIGFFFSHFFNINAGYILGIGGLLLSIVIFSIGLLAVLLKQIMDK